MREFLTSGIGILALVCTILGVVFTGVGLALTAFVRPQAIGIMFLCAGGVILPAGILFIVMRLAALRRRARILATGMEVHGAIVDIAQSPVRINGRHPWVVRYRYEVQGSEYEGRETMMDLPAGYEAGASVAVMYDPDQVSVSVLDRDG